MATSASQASPVEEVIARFPEDGERIARLAAESESFRSLCEDYALVLGTLAGLDGSGDEVRVADYRALAADLEREIRVVLAEDRA
jgi:hypothetical protein